MKLYQKIFYTVFSLYAIVAAIILVVIASAISVNISDYAKFQNVLNLVGKCLFGYLILAIIVRLTVGMVSAWREKHKEKP